MALKGNLRDFTITQLLNVINLAKKTGALVIESSGQSARLYFREGRLAYAEIPQEDNSLAAILKHGQKISNSQYHIIKEKAGQMPDKELGLLLVNAGYVTQQDVLVSLQQYCTGIVRRLFTWAEGLFRFEPDQSPPEDKIGVKISLENLIIEGSRQLREWEQLQEEIPSLEIALRFTERPGANLKNVNLSVEEWRVVHFINPKNSIHQIAQATKMNDLEIRRVVYGLMQAGLVEFIRPPGLSGSVFSRMFPTTNKEEQKSLVNRLINRIRAI